MICKDYKKGDLTKKKYAIIEYVLEDNMHYIVSLHEDYTKAKKRLGYLKREAKRLFERGIDSVDYGLYETNSPIITKCFNYEREDI